MDEIEREVPQSLHKASFILLVNGYRIHVQEDGVHVVYRVRGDSLGSRVVTLLREVSHGRLTRYGDGITFTESRQIVRALRAVTKEATNLSRSIDLCVRDGILPLDLDSEEDY